MLVCLYVLFGMYQESRGLGVEMKTSKVEEKGEKVRVASYNVWNLELNNGRVEKVASHIKIELGSPAIVGLVEIVDDLENSGESDGLLQQLCDYVNKENTVVYKYTYIQAEDGTDGGKPGNNIKQAILYDTNIFDSVPSKGKSNDKCDAEFTKNPCRIDPGNRAFADSRKPLVAKLTLSKTKETIVAIVNHLISKVSGSGSDRTRKIQAEIVSSFVGELDGNIICMGDFNDTPDSESYKIINTELADALSYVTEEERYTYVFRKRRQQIDFIFSSEEMMTHFKSSNIPHLNSYKRRVSDHDPVYADFEF